MKSDFAAVIGSISIAMQVLFAGIAVSTTDPAESRGRRLMLSLATSAAPLATLALFMYVFVIGGATNIAQLNTAAGHDLWGIWAWACFVLVLANPASLLGAVVFSALPPNRHQGVSFHLSRLMAIPAALCACYIVWALFPDA